MLKGLYDFSVSEEVDHFIGVQLVDNFNSAGSLVSLNMSQPIYMETIHRQFGLDDSKPA